jgi:pyrroloquinoline quinone biosynthesis protein E
LLLRKINGFSLLAKADSRADSIASVADILAMAEELGADYVELANTQYYGWAHANRDLLMPTQEQYQEAEEIAQAFKEKVAGKMKIYYVSMRPTVILGIG